MNAELWCQLWRYSADFNYKPGIMLPQFQRDRDIVAILRLFGGGIFDYLSFGSWPVGCYLPCTPTKGGDFTCT